MKTRVLRIINRLNVGGPTYNVANLSKFIGDEFETKILSGNIERNEASSEYILRDLGLEYGFVPRMHRSLNLKNDLFAYRYIKQFIQEYDPKIVHTHAAKAGALGRLAAYNSGVPHIVHTYHGNVFDGYFSPLKTKMILKTERFLCKKTSAVIAISEEQKEDIVHKYKIVEAERVHVIKLGFDLRKFQDQTEIKRNAIRKEFRFEDETIVVSIVGRLTQIKNHRLFLDAFKAAKQSTSRKLRGLIVGDGELKDELMLYGESIGLKCSYLPDIGKVFDADIIFTSWRKDVDAIYAGSDIVSMTSKNEGTPVSLIEALAGGKPVITTNVGGVSAVVHHGVNGFLTKNNSEDFLHYFTTLITSDQIRTNFAENAKHSVSDFSYTRLVREVADLYKCLLSKKII